MVQVLKTDFDDSDGGPQLPIPSSETKEPLLLKE